MGEYPARVLQEREDLLAETRRQQTTIRRLSEDLDALVTALRWMLGNMTITDGAVPEHVRILTGEYESITNLARHCGVDPERLRELLEVT